MKITVLALLALAVAVAPAAAQEFSFDEFVGTWEGTISSPGNGWSLPTTLVVEPDGFYTDSSGWLMPATYHGTQLCEFEESTNRVHFWYLHYVNGGENFYLHFFYEVVEYTGNYLEMHYNPDDDEIPYPEVQTIALTRAGTTPVRDTTPAVAVELSAYPNPFNPATRVAFELPAAGAVRLEVFDLQGRRVAVLHDGPLAAGRHELEWRGRDENGASVAGGVYLARVVTASSSRTVKLSLAK
jgi:hypothetical protein